MAQFSPMPLLLGNEQADGIEELGVADLRGVVLGRPEQMAAIGRFAELPSSKRLGDAVEFFRGHSRTGIPRHFLQVGGIRLEVRDPLGGTSHGLGHDRNLTCC